MKKMQKKPLIVLGLISFGILISFQNCAEADKVEALSTTSPSNLSEVKIVPQAVTGPYSLSGTILFPTFVASGTNVQISYIKLDAPTSGEAGTTALTSTGSMAKYIIEGLPAGQYQIRFKVDMNRDGLFSSVGDLEGYFNGGTVNPVISAVQASTVSIVDKSVNNLNFPVGAL